MDAISQTCALIRERFDRETSAYKEIVEGYASFAQKCRKYETQLREQAATIHELQQRAAGGASKDELANAQEELSHVRTELGQSYKSNAQISSELLETNKAVLLLRESGELRDARISELEKGLEEERLRSSSLRSQLDTQTDALAAATEEAQASMAAKAAAWKVAEEVRAENAMLIDRWTRLKLEEAEKMNEANAMMAEAQRLSSSSLLVSLAQSKSDGVVRKAEAPQADWLHRQQQAAPSVPRSTFQAHDGACLALRFEPHSGSSQGSLHIVTGGEDRRTKHWRIAGDIHTFRPRSASTDGAREGGGGGTARRSSAPGGHQAPDSIDDPYTSLPPARLLGTVSSAPGSVMDLVVVQAGGGCGGGQGGAGAPAGGQGAAGRGGAGSLGSLALGSLPASSAPSPTLVLCACSDKRLLLLDLESGRCKLALTGHQDKVTAVDVLGAAAGGGGDGGAAGGGGGRGRGVRAGNGGKPQAAPATPDVAASLRSTFSSLSSSFSASLSPSHSLPTTGSVNTAAAVSASYDRTLRVWDLTRGSTTTTLLCPSLCNTVGWWGDHPAVIYSGHADGHIRVWDVRSGRVAHEIAAHSQPITSVVLPRVSGGGSRRKVFTCGRDNTVRGFDALSFELCHTFRANGFSVASNWSRATVSPSGRLVAAGSSNGHVFLWDTHKDALHSVLMHGHRDPVIACAWSEREGVMASGDRAGRVTVWA